MAKKILFVGDSITHAGDWLTSIDFAQIENIAIPGYNTDDVQAQMEIIEKSAPDAISLLIGTNDFSNPELDRSGEDVGERVVDIIKSILNRVSDAPIVVTSILPRGLQYSDRIIMANNVIRNFYHARVTHLDSWKSLSLNNYLNPAYWLDDGIDVHINELGYEVWKELLIPKLRNVVIG